LGQKKEKMEGVSVGGKEAKPGTGLIKKRKGIERKIRHGGSGGINV